MQSHRWISFGQSITVLDYGLCATIHVSQLQDGTWDTSERFEQEWNEMVRELAREGYSSITDEPAVTFSAPLSATIIGQFEVYYVYRVAEFGMFDLTALEQTAQV